MKRGVPILSLLLAIAPLPAFALGPHEVLVLANGLSSNSVRVAETYVRLRRVPERNLVRIDIPAEYLRPSPDISPAAFERLIWAPVRRALRARELDDHILAWVYSTDFPIRVSTQPAMSVQGLTFLRNRLPDMERDVKRGQYRSPFFAGPDGKGGGIEEPATFDTFARWLGEEMPVPSMMLGYTGERGNTVDEVLACFERSVAADGTYPAGTVYFATRDDVRSECRDWQFRGAELELEAMGVAAEIAAGFPADRADVLGLQIGAAQVEPDGHGNTYLPGAMLEHLTSAGAVFARAGQTKISAWIRAGASASCGAVTEPYALWMKFPSARFFVHYASGCTMLESFYQSIRCPLQVLLVGDPLVRPWGAAGNLRIAGLGDGTLSGKVRLQAVPPLDPDAHYSAFVFLLDGRMVGRDRQFVLDTRAYADGAYRLRCVAYRTGLVRQQVFAEREVVIRNARQGEESGGR